MTAITWFRKNNKKLLAFVGVALMVGFLLPQFGRSMGGGGQTATVAYYVFDGQEEECTNRDLQLAANDLKILQALQIPLMYYRSERGAIPVVSTIENMGGINQIAVMATNTLLLGENMASQQIRSMLYQAVVGQGKTRAEQEALAADVEAIVDSTTVRPSVLYYLLLKEADSAGLAATTAQVEALLQARGQLIGAQQLSPISIQSVINQVAGTENNLKAAVGRYLTVIECVNALSRGMAVSEPQLRHAVRDELAVMNVEGDYVAFDIDLFEADVAEPSEAELVAQLDAYKSSLSGDVTDENPHGFGYMLPDRVKVEYLQVDLTQVNSVVEAQFRAKTAAEREALVRDYWSTHMEMFREAAGEGDVAGTYRDPSFDEVADRAQMMYLASAANDAATEVLNEARQLSRVTNGDDLLAAADYSELAGQVSTDVVEVTAGSTDYLSMASAQEYGDFARTFRMRGNRPEAALVEMLFTCKALQDEDATGRETGGLQLNQSEGPLTSFDQFYQPSGMCVVRIVGADKSREPVSLDDDGRSGAVGAELVDGESTLRAQVVKDVRGLAAFAVAGQRADDFALAASTDWDGALAALNAEIGDPNQTLFADSVSGVRSLMEQWQQNLRREDLSRPELQELLGRMATVVRLAAEEAKAREEGETGLVTAADERWGRWLVFKNLWVTPLAEDDYAERRALIAQRWLNDAQSVAVVAHLNPESIQERMSFRWREDDEAEEAEETQE